MALSFVATPTTSNSTSITLPTHAAGDLLLIMACRTNSVLCGKPSAGGTVPTWVDIDANAGADSISMRTAYAIATAANHTSGTWANSTRLAAASIRGIKTDGPIGGHVEQASAVFDSGADQAMTAPAITLAMPSGSSFILEMYFVDSNATFAAAPTGYTLQVKLEGSKSLLLGSKDVTITDGAVDWHCTCDIKPIRVSTIEILAPGSPGAFFSMFDNL